MPRIVITHLVDDVTAGGVMRVVDFLTSSPEMQEVGEHRIMHINPNSPGIGPLKSDVVISHLTISWRMLPSLLSLKLCNPRTKLIHVEHSYTENFVNLNVSNVVRFKTLLRVAYRIFNNVIAVSRAQYKWMNAWSLVSARSLAFIPSCVDLSAFRELPPPRKHVRILGAIGRLEPQKGFDKLIAAFVTTKCRNLELHIYGKGSEEQKLRRLAKGDQRIRFMGFAKDAVEAIRNVDAVAMPSQWEAYGLVAVEALTAKRKLLVSGIDGLNDHLAYGAIDTSCHSISGWALTIERLASGSFVEPSEMWANSINFERNAIARWKRLFSD